MPYMKATLLDDDAFRLLAIPFGGPIPSPHSPRGVDLDGEWFDERTDIKADLFPVREVDWHHAKDGVMARTVLGKAVDPELEEDGWWVTVWLRAGERRLALIRELAERGAQLFGSSQAPRGTTSIDKATGHIDVWPYWRQALSTSPQNTYSVLRPLKADADAEARPYKAVDLPIEAMRDLAADLRLTSERGDDVATSRRLAAAISDLDAKTRRLLEVTRT